MKQFLFSALCAVGLLVPASAQTQRFTVSELSGIFGSTTHEHPTILKDGLTGKYYRFAVIRGRFSIAPSSSGRGAKRSLLFRDSSGATHTLFISNERLFIK